MIRVISAHVDDLSRAESFAGAGSLAVALFE